MPAARLFMQQVAVMALKKQAAHYSVHAVGSGRLCWICIRERLIIRVQMLMRDYRIGNWVVCVAEKNFFVVAYFPLTTIACRLRLGWWLAGGL